MPRIQGDIMKGWTEDDIANLHVKNELKKNDLYNKRMDMLKHNIKPLPKPKRKAKVGKGAQQPNKTEAEYAMLFLAGKNDFRFQALTFHMKNGCDYTPDWVVFENGSPIIAIECKGSYRFHSQGRAKLAFLQCKLEYCGIIDFRWAVKTKEGWVHE